MAHARHRKADGGGTPPSKEAKNKHEIDPAEPTMHEADEKDDGFKRGGRKHRKHGGRIDGHKGHHRLDRKSRGGRAMKSGGVLSSAATVKTATKGGSSDSESLGVD